MKYVIITSGGSQLITQISTLKQLNLLKSGIEVYYIGVEYDTLTQVLKSICNTYSLNYKGRISDISIPKKYALKDYKRPKKLVKEFLRTTLINKQIEKENPELSQIKGCYLIITFRHKILADALLINYIQPERILLTADGVIDQPFERNFNTIGWSKVKTPINTIPVQGKIYTPSYLADDTKKVGEVEIIPDDIIEDCFKELSVIDDFKSLKETVEKVGPKSIIFSQHLALNKNCTENEEVKYYADIVKTRIREQDFPVVVKLHPRDADTKIKALQETLNSLGSKAIVLSRKDSAIPIEIMYEYIKNNAVGLITASSSAPLFIRSELSQLISDTSHYLTIIT